MTEAMEIRLNELRETEISELNAVREEISKYGASIEAGSLEAAAAAFESAQEHAKACNKARRSIAMIEFTESTAEVPFVEFATLGGFYRTVKVSEKKTESGIPYVELSVGEKFLDPMRTPETKWHNLTAQPYAFHLVQALYVLCTKDEVQTLTGMKANEFKEQFAQFIKVTEYKSENGKVLPKIEVSNTKLLSALRTVISALAGDELGRKVISADVRFFRSAFSKAVVGMSNGSVTRKVTVFKIADMMKILTAIVNRVIFDGGYDVECKSVKKLKES